MPKSYAEISGQLGKITGPTKSKSKEIYDAAIAAGHSVRYLWGYDPNKSNTEHHSGRSLDFMVYDKTTGKFIRDYIWKNRKRLGLQHVIWDQHITSTTTQPGKIRLMADRGNPTANHKDHVHVLFFTGAYEKPSDGGTDPKPPTKKTNEEVAAEIVAGKGGWGNNPLRAQRLSEAGFEPTAVQLLVEKLMKKETPQRKSNGQIAGEVIAGKWGHGAERKRRLQADGYNYDAVQKEVNRLLTPKGETKPKLTVAQIATQVINGQWGDGDDRKRRVTRAGHNYSAVQAEVNRRLR